MAAPGVTMLIVVSVRGCVIFAATAIRVFTVMPVAVLLGKLPYLTDGMVCAVLEGNGWVNLLQFGYREVFCRAYVMFVRVGFNFFGHCEHISRYIVFALLKRQVYCGP
jgi:hypothetical protein